MTKLCSSSGGQSTLPRFSCYQSWITLRLSFHFRFFLVLTMILVQLPQQAEPINITGRCKERCDNHRQPTLNTDAFTFDCDTWYDKDDERQYCRKDCRKCPAEVCDLSQPNIFNCPELLNLVPYYEACKDLCDYHREIGDLDKYILKCDEVYTLPSEIDECKKKCDLLCPVSVCDSLIDDNWFQCPRGEYYGKCKQDCEYHRDRLSKDHNWFKYYCTDFSPWDRDQCRLDCNSCPKMICDSTKNEDEYTCPTIPEVVTTTTATTTTTTTTTPKPGPKYEGPCKQRCDKFRLGGSGSYSFRCHNLFSSTSDELEACREDCDKCPKNVCSYGSFDCPKAEYHIEEEEDVKRVRYARTSWGLIAAIGIAIAMTIFCAIATCCYCKQRKQVGGAQTGAVTPMQYPAGGYYNYNYGQQMALPMESLDSSASNATLASTKNYPVQL